MERQGHRFETTVAGCRCRWCGLTLVPELDRVRPNLGTVTAASAPCEPLPL